MLKAAVIDFHDDPDISANIVSTFLQKSINFFDLHHERGNEFQNIYGKEKYDLIILLLNHKKEDWHIVEEQLILFAEKSDNDMMREMENYYRHKVQ
jgi:hypothetical protein